MTHTTGSLPTGNGCEAHGFDSRMALRVQGDPPQPPSRERMTHANRSASKHPERRRRPVVRLDRAVGRPDREHGSAPGSDDPGRRTAVLDPGRVG
ncbi:MAG: hypothetical protein K0U49_11570 [Alphaproteobacteria bacterium]|nr:hypothetical protein [Alphaproteobacteria bacterium]